jgi:glycosyltransferase involved in cell wall biosynthesis
MKKVTILLATYNPNLDWLRQQLISLENQTYRDLSLVILDDCSPDVDFAAIEDIVKMCIQSFDYQLFNNEKNLGSCKTFEKLTDIGTGDYFAYCDQDDIWEKDKVQRIMDFATDEDHLIYTDLCIIEENGNKTHDSLRDIRARLVHRKGESLAKIMLFRPFVTGCTMVVKAQIAKRSIPFVGEMIGDHHIALFAASKGNIAYLDEPLVRYRQHGNNVTGIMKGVYSKKDYVDIRITPLISQFNKLKMTYHDDAKMLMHINGGLKWLNARSQYLSGKWWYGCVMMALSRYNFKTSLFDLMIPLMPKRVFEKALKKIRGESA